ncbi:hypothetical protein A3H38_03330 [candidate division WOR-1 bacterium RIFCSPLOWO2_02_FULL_46_20]|uniref:Type II secretion system protein M n=2 Tax=Saganbacteria TaxID=1703751 RepID=A0A1F4RGD0_UNCSA|nr:MAG: hypothetical protein A3J44_06965 [candidate division WOR-1 bacterium RIFCSPHIGHO2_02_FULL_45_12]OGC07221.1 MAG: hypothetical protein A3H38_03330 [candidate division WOR-1 bacterium RIFCSPLOWO2_02_FULL_46_20]OGC10001.1 MAG: hypothetical protein A3F86_03730 [candidate division WOR-1 bacterium RIFCSPLOWO2_12_FULL_45_9]
MKKLKLSDREKNLLIATTVFVVFFIYWQVYLNPLIKATDGMRSEISTLRTKLEYNPYAQAESPLSKSREIKIYPKEEQLGRIMTFIDDKFKWFGIKMISLRQGEVEKKQLTIDLKFKATSDQFSGFLNSLHELKTVLLIASADVDQENTKIIAEINFISPYQ